MMITEELVRLIMQTQMDDIPIEIQAHSKRSLLNWMGVAIGASYHESVDMALDVANAVGRNEQSTILGRGIKTDMLFASLINGMSSHIFDYDDTHLDTIHHPSGPVAPVVFALGEQLNIPGDQLLRAFILGCEAQLRISNAIYPSHYTLGWHITSSTGVFGAAVAAGLLLDLDEEQMLMSLGIAGTQSLGLREMFGTMTKPFHPGRAAEAGLLSAMLAGKGFTSSKQVLEAKRGFANVTAPEHDLSKVTVDWGKVWEIGKNSFKPYACGIVLHPSIDVCIALREYAENAADVDRIELYVNQYVLELTGKKEPSTGLEGKFSIYHTAAIAFLEGDAGQEQYETEKVNDEKTIEMRKKIVPIVVDEMREHEAKGKIILKNGQEYEYFVEFATGSKENPMDDSALERKFKKVTKSLLTDEQKNRIIDRMNSFEKLENIHEIIELSYIR